MAMLGLRDLVVVAPATTTPMAEPIFPNHHQASSATATALGIGIGAFPLLATQPPGTAAEGNHSKAHQAFGGGDPGTLSSSSSSAMACRDCGNKAKKDCKYRRCRTCCKSRGYDCSTHVKSTWVPAARRRERQMMVSGAAVNAAGGGGGSSGSSTADGKRPRLAVAGGSSNTTGSTKSFDTISSQQGAGSKVDRLPGQVRAPAVFRCVRMTAVDEGGTDEIAYQAMVKIGGHMFKGLLCDQGVDHKDKYGCISEVQLESVSNCERNNRESYSSPRPPGHSRAFVTSSNCGLVAGNAAAYNDHPVD